MRGREKKLDWRRLLGVALASLLVTAARAEPLDLSDPTPRWIEVRFEISPEDAPGRLDHAWSPARRAFLEPIVGQRAIRIRIPREELERQLRSNGTDPVDGSFSEFVWTLDPATGHVLAAELSGRVREVFSLGFLRSAAEIEIRVEMTTRAVAGYRPVHQILGQPLHAFCAGPEQARDCTLVQPSLYDPHRGYVNAVGSLRAVSALAHIQTFSPLGEVVFSESADNEKHGESRVSGASPHDAVCSGPFGGSCRPDLRGESS